VFGTWLTRVRRLMATRRRGHGVWGAAFRVLLVLRLARLLRAHRFGGRVFHRQAGRTTSASSSPARVVPGVARVPAHVPAT